LLFELSDLRSGLAPVYHIAGDLASHLGTACLARNLNRAATNPKSRTMTLDRRRFLTFSAVGAAVAAEPFAAERAVAGPRSSVGIDAMHFGVRAGGADDQTRALQDAIDQAAGARVPLALGPGVYRAGDLKLPAGAHIIGVRSATRLVLTRGPSLISANHADGIALMGLILDGGGMPLPEGRGLVHFADGRGVRIADCEIIAAGRHGIMLEAIEGEVTGSTVTGAEGAAVFSLDARGLRLAGNTIRGAGNNGILVWRSAPGDDGTLVLDNRIEDIAARAGGAGQNGNAINVFRAGNVMVRGNRISGAAFSAIRGNAAANLQMLGNTCTGLGEVALYAEYGFEGAVIANNVVDGAALGVAVTNFREGGRLAVVQGNIIRNLTPKRPPGADPHDPAGIGIGIEADSAVTGNVIENAPTAGIQLGWGQYLRDVTVTGNVVRGSDVGIAVSVVPGAGSAVIADNLISGARRGAILGMDGRNAVTGDLATDGGRFAHLAISGNRVR
jgi:uncharacterized secreted repeat protein (TIGR03808 family)